MNTSIQLRLTPQHFQHLCRQAAEQPDREICGLIGGYWRKNIALVQQCVSIPNHSPRLEAHFIMSQYDLETTLRHFYQKNLSLLSIYHSHPHGPAHPSTQDIDAASYPAIYLILFPEKILDKNEKQALKTPVIMGYTANAWYINGQQLSPAHVLVSEND